MAVLRMTEAQVTTSTRRLPRRRGLAPTTLLLSSSVQKLLGWRGVERWRPREPFVLPFPHLPHQWPQTTMVINSSACRINSSGFRRTWNRSQSRRTCRASRVCLTPGRISLLCLCEARLRARNSQ
ncbi:unnamed protein product, partial [Symbiodinium microadriaticum]